jgi:hypothetical protein
MRPALLSLAIGIGLASPALAEDLGGFARTAADYTFPAGDPVLTVQPVGPVAVAGLPVLFETTTLSVITSKFGGTVQTERDATDATYAFACYNLGNRTLWVRGNGSGGSAAVSMIVLESGAPQAGWDCADAPDSLDTVSFGIPGLGAPTEEVSARLGSSTPDSLGRFGYTSEVPSDADPGSFIRQTILYRADNGTVNAVAVSQKTSG